MERGSERLARQTKRETVSLRDEKLAGRGGRRSEERGHRYAFLLRNNDPNHSDKLSAVKGVVVLLGNTGKELRIIAINSSCVQTIKTSNKKETYKSLETMCTSLQHTNLMFSVLFVCYLFLKSHFLQYLRRATMAWMNLGKDCTVTMVVALYLDVHARTFHLTSLLPATFCIVLNVGIRCTSHMSFGQNA